MQNILFVDFLLLNVLEKNPNDYDCKSYSGFFIPSPLSHSQKNKKKLQRKLINLETYTVADIE